MGSAKRWSVWSGVAAIFAVALLLFIVPAAHAAPTKGAGTGLAVIGKSGGLAQVGRVSLVPQGNVAGEVHALGIVSFPTTVTSAAPSSGVRVSSAITPLAASPAVVGKFAGAGQSTSGGYYPPDPQVAAGGSFVFEIVNELARITTKTGTLKSSFTTQSAFSLTSTDNVGDVQVLYDNLSHRWMYSADDFTTNNVYLAVSTTSSPLGTWFTYVYMVFWSGFGAQFMDQPELGVSKTMVGLGQNIFNSTTFAFLGAAAIVFKKSAIESGTGTFHLFGTFGVPSVHPARQISTNGTGKDVFYWATTGTSSSSTTLTVYNVLWGSTAVTVTSFAYTIASTGAVPGGVQTGTTTLIATGDDRVLSMGWANGVAWVSYATACYPSGDFTLRSCVRVDAITTGFNTMDQDSDVGVAGYSVYYGALTPVRGGIGYLMVMGFSGPLNYPSIALTGQSSIDPFGTFRGPTVAVVGTANDTSGRYGDYFGAQIDFSGSSAIPLAWGVGEFDTASNTWGTEVVHFGF